MGLCIIEGFGLNLAIIALADYQLDSSAVTIVVKNKRAGHQGSQHSHQMEERGGLMLENNADMNSSPNQNPGETRGYVEFLDRAAQAESDGKDTEALYFYLVAYEMAQRAEGKGELDEAHPAVIGLRKAWEISCKLDERSLAEYVFEKIQRYLNDEDMQSYAEQLQSLALHKLEEFGLSREDVEDVADMISEDFFGTGAGALDLDISSVKPSTGLAKLEAQLPSTIDAPQASEETEGSVFGEYNYDSLVGFDTAIADMHRRGYGIRDDAEFDEFVKRINARHGIDHLPSTETLIFRAPAREDADQLMLATAAEMALPTVRMHMDENAQGVPVLCVLASPDFKSQMNLSFNNLQGPGVLILEDIDLWGMPVGDNGFDELDNLTYAQLSRGARKAIVLIRSAVENPNITVFASASTESPIDDFMYDLLDPLVPMDLSAPNVAERAAIWAHIAERHPSIDQIDRIDLVRLTANMSRYDIFMAAREAIEEAYRNSIADRAYVPVTKDNMYDKIAAYQPLDSKEYHQLEDAIIEDFRSDLEDFENRFKGKK